MTDMQSEGAERPIARVLGEFSPERDSTSRSDAVAAGGARGVGAIALVQVVAFVVLALLVGAMWLVDVQTQMALAVFAVAVLWMLTLAFWPEHGMLADKVVGILGSVALGFVSVVVLFDALPSSGRGVRIPGFPRHGAPALLNACTSWAVAFVAVLVCYVVVGFLSQMLRRERTNLVLSLSGDLAFNTVLTACVGWLFLPVLVWYVKSGGAAPQGSLSWVAVLVLVLALAIAVALCVASYRWWRGLAEAQAQVSQTGRAGSSRLWISFALIPVMSSGLAVWLAAVVLFALAA